MPSSVDKYEKWFRGLKKREPLAAALIEALWVGHRDAKEAAGYEGCDHYGGAVDAIVDQIKRA